MHIAPARSADNQRCWRIPAIVCLRHHVGYLIEGTSDEIHELKFRYWTQSSERSAKRRTDDCGFCDWRVDDTLGTESIDEAICNFEGAAVDADVLADTENGRIALHLFPDSLADRFEIWELHPAPGNSYFR